MTWAWRGVDIVNLQFALADSQFAIPTPAPVLLLVILESGRVGIAHHVAPARWAVPTLPLAGSIGRR